MFFFFFNDTATTEIYTLSLHDALPISAQLDSSRGGLAGRDPDAAHRRRSVNTAGDRTVIGHAVLAQDVGDDDARLVPGGVRVWSDPGHIAGGPDTATACRRLPRGRGRLLGGCGCGGTRRRQGCRPRL